MEPREVYFRVSVDPDGKAGRIAVFRRDGTDGRLSPREWDEFTEALLRQLPAAIENRKELER